MVLIRPAEENDVDALYEICLRTGNGGADASAIYQDSRLLGEVYVGPYLMISGGFGLTAVDDTGPAGYAVAVADTVRFEAECEQSWWPGLRARRPDPGPHPVTRDQKIITLIHRPVRASADVVATFPAHLHINLLPRLQGRGVGRRLIDLLLADLAVLGATGVHLGVDPRNHPAMGFYRHLGFATLKTGPGSIVMGKQLN